MIKLLTHIIPAFYGLLVYFTIRIVNDTVSGFRFWERWWGTITIELITSIFMGYLSFYLLNKFEREMLQKSWREINWKTGVKDFFNVYVYTFLMVNLVITPMAAFTDDGLSIFDFVQINTIPVLYMLLLYAIMRGNVFLRAYVENQLNIEKAKSEQLSSELAYLKAQIHPHFLFNALNTIYFEMDESVERAKLTLERFSELLRYQLYSKENSMISLKKEIAHLQNYISLQEKRASTKLKASIAFPDVVASDLMVHPFLMLPLVENAFKYVGGEYHLIIRAELRGEALHFYTRNAKRQQASVPAPDSGIGIRNLQRRLELLYENEYRLDINETAHYYEVTLEVELTKL